ncbi:MAG: radical SAM family heme chaperone HemW [Granulosicoccus sp.]|nr:radical SAM family heme chaperone HemW [Granulosicoccus sp.]
MRRFFELPPLSLYIHIPWCIKKCPYCDFNSHEQREALPENDYVDALLADLSDELPLVWGRSISSVFIGGGTPSLFSANALDQLLSGIRALTGLSPGIELTLEANPGSVEQQRFEDYRSLGINRLSLGIQSFDDRFLQALGRVHSANESFTAVEIAHAAGFDQINLDLMFALPGQSTKACIDDIKHALSQSTTHLSCYELTLEPNTRFARFPPVLPSDDDKASMAQHIEERLQNAGFDRYEVSAYALTAPEKGAGSNPNRSQHNVNYWLFGDYIGIGAGAHGKISSAQNGKIVRRWKQRHPKAYLRAKSASERLGGQSTVDIQDTAVEFMMNALRLREGFPIPLFERHTGVAMDRWQSVIDVAIEDGLLMQSGMNLLATPHGFRWLNDLVGKFLSDAESEINDKSVSSYPTISLKLKN